MVGAKDKKPEAATEKEIMGEHCLVACLAWLAQLVSYTTQDLSGGHTVDSDLASYRFTQFTSLTLLSAAHTSCTVVSVWFPTYLLLFLVVNPQ